MGLKIGALSDLHIDFIFRPDKKLTVNKVRHNFDYIFEPHVGLDILFIPGDIGHYNRQNVEFLQLIQKIYKIKDIVITYGNHEMYLVSKTMRLFYKTSINKLEGFKFLLKDLDGITILDGDSKRIQDVLVAGACGWYDGSYIRRISKSIYGENNDTLWRRTSNDANYITNNGSFLDIFPYENQKIRKAIQHKPDIMLSHICPVSEPCIISEQFKFEKTTGFYTFDGLNLIKEYKPKFWFYGHMHDKLEYQLFDTTLLRNPHGYPEENSNIELITYNI